MTFIGLTWDHPRGRDPLVAAAAKLNAGHAAPLLEWRTQPLEGFESAPIEELAAKYDLLVLDHPHIGEAVAKRCLLPLEQFFDRRELTAWETQTVGPAFTSYVWPEENGTPKSWALPLDVATQVMARRADVVSEAPSTWTGMVKLAGRAKVAQSLGGPHAFLTFMSMVAASGGVVGDDDLVTTEPALHALEMMHALYAQRPAGSEALNPIALCEAMADGAIDCIPLIFGYVTYARAAQRGQIAFSNSLCLSGAGTGGVLGGTGLAISARCKPTAELLDHLRWIMHPATQSNLLPAKGGQPSARAAWQDAGVNAQWGNFYRDCLQTAEMALLRPRFDGYVAFQTRAADHVRRALETGEDKTITLMALRGLWSAARDAASGPLDRLPELTRST